jgi:hypothetical protein
MKFLKHHPVADDVLDIVGHHRKHEGRELGLESPMAHRRKGALRGRRRTDGGSFRISHEIPSRAAQCEGHIRSLMHLDMFGRIPNSGDLIVRPTVMSMADQGLACMARIPFKPLD